MRFKLFQRKCKHIFHTLSVLQHCTVTSIFLKLSRKSELKYRHQHICAGNNEMYLLIVYLYIHMLNVIHCFLLPIFLLLNVNLVGKCFLQFSKYNLVLPGTTFLIILEVHFSRVLKIDSILSITWGEKHLKIIKRQCLGDLLSRWQTQTK